jgi:hypothetical protein
VKLTKSAVPTALALLLLATACAGTRAADVFDETSPPPHLGRPTWVRVPARIGAYAGGIVGGLVSIVLLPVTWPISVLADDALGEDRADFLLFPAFLGAGAGHFLLGAPPDLLHYVGYRAWVDEPPPPGYDHVPPAPAPGAGGELEPQPPSADTRPATPRGGE